LSVPESVAAFLDRFIVKSKLLLNYLHHLEVMELKKKRAEEKAKENQKTKSYDDYA